MYSSLLSFPGGWDSLLASEKSKNYFINLIELVSKRYEMSAVYPPIDEVYRALSLIEPEEVKAVILGQDPYFNPGQADGLAFSVKEGVRLPPSLLNIFKELREEYGYPIPASGDLTPWAKQGVLLLNTSLTVEEGKPNSHAGFGWNRFTDEIIKKLDESDRPIVYLLWGNSALSKKNLIFSKNAVILHTAHPSPLSASRGFLHSGCFKKVNEALKSLSLTEIDWKID